MEQGKQRLLQWLSEVSGERVVNWERVSQGDIICFILYRMSPSKVDIQKITDGVDRFARVKNWRIANKAMRSLGIGWTYDEVRLVMADQPELTRLVLSIRRWQVRNLDQPLEPPLPNEFNPSEIPAWFTQQTAKEIEENKIASGEPPRRDRRAATK